MFGFKSSRLYSQCLVELKNQILHSLSGTDDEPRQRPGVAWLEEPTNSQGGYGDGHCQSTEFQGDALRMAYLWSGNLRLGREDHI